MTRALQGQELANLVRERFPEADLEWEGDSLWIEPHSIPDVALFLREEPGLAFSYLNAISAVDYVEYYEVVYHLTSLQHNHSAVVKTRLYDREAPTVTSVVGVWPGANFQEREIWDLMGVAFEGHPNLKRIMLWEGFPGHPHRRDFEDVVQY